MNETGKRKEWIKTIAIIFLAILLVLTFFSNTIKNYSLPEVAAQYTYSGSITNKVRGTATVEASDPYSVIFKADRKVESVSVRVGDEVSKGDVLYVLEEGESEELKEARKTLETLQNAYDKGLVLGQISKELAGKVENGSIGSASEMQDKVTAAKKKVDNAKAYLENLQKEQASAGNQSDNANAELEKQIASMQSTVSSLRTKGKEQLEPAMNSAEYELLNVATIEKDGVTGKTVVNILLSYVENLPSPSAEELATATSLKYELAKERVDIKFIKQAIEFVEKAYKNHNAESELDSATTFTPPGYYSADVKYDILLNQKLKAFDQAQVNYYKNEDSIAACQKQIDLWEAEKTSSTGNDYSSKIADAQTSLEKAEKAYNDLVAEINTSFDLLDQIEQINAQKDTIAKLEKEQGSSEITAPVSGTVLSMAYSAGETIKQGDTVSTIQIAGKGYTMSVSIPNDKVRYIAVGDEAEITNSWWYSDVHARIATIRPDPSNPAQNKLVTFELEGDVTSGQSLSFSVGKKSANYENIVPNSAIHEDNKGKFIYKINSKSTPLGNRYIIERIDVTVIASDDTQSAVTGALEGWDYIATTASKPIEDGTEVRLKD